MREMCYNVGTLTFDPFLAHYGVKGMKWGVQKIPERIKTAKINRKHDDAYIEKGEKYSQYFHKKNGQIAVTDDERMNPHFGNPSKYKPYAVVQIMNKGSKQIDRILYDKGGMMVKQIHSGGHWGDHSSEPWNGAHVHEFNSKTHKNIIYKDGKHLRKLTKEEVREHRDILTRRRKSV